MLKLRKAITVLEPGNRFEKLGLWASVWTVEEVFQPPGLPQHARLVDSNTGRYMTVAQSVLHDPNCFAALGITQ
jgi:hypothetical protein